jgi:hypothetical protein
MPCLAEPGWRLALNPYLDICLIHQGRGRIKRFRRVSAIENQYSASHIFLIKRSTGASIA